MNVNEHTSGDIDTHGGGERPPCTGLTPDALPEVQKPVLAENSQTGVSTRNALSGTEEAASDGVNVIPNKIIKRKPKDVPHWYALRVTYGREKRAYDYLIGKHVEAYYPTIKTVKEVDGKRKSVEESRLPNIFFARGTEEEIKSFVYDNVNLPYLRFYYRHFHEGARVTREPLIVPDYQIESLKIICASEAEDIILELSNVRKFEQGQTVRIIDGAFKGVVGKVARYQGQQRVAVIIDGLFTVATAYIPTAFLEKNEENT
ncbi:MAG: UpxY family transcription antiterminator [Prevotellaceae bacterium]|nr:UpxY family transcription antiterminator [Prevotellaceae bacterium]